MLPRVDFVRNANPMPFGGPKTFAFGVDGHLIEPGVVIAQN
jgi:hypothetical protein